MEKAPKPQADQQDAQIMNQFDTIDQVEYQNGAKHVYGVDENGKKVHVSHDAVLKNYGYDPKTHMDLEPVAPDIEEPAVPSPNVSINSLDDLDLSIESNEPTSLDSLVDSKSNLDNSTTRFNEKNGRAKFDAAREMDSAKKEYKKAEQTAKLDKLKHERRVKVVSDYLELMDKQSESGPDYVRSTEEDAVLEQFDELEASQKRHGLSPLAELVSRDDVNYYRLSQDKGNTTEIVAPEQPVEPTPEPTIEPTPEAPAEVPKTASELARDFLQSKDNIELSHEMGLALNEYTELLAKHEIKHRSKNRDKEQLENARLKYEKVRSKMLTAMVTEMDSTELSADEINEELAKQQFGEHLNGEGGDLGLLENVSRIEAEQIARSSRVARFLTNAWSKKGARGVLGKALIMSPVGIAAGATAGIVAGPVVGAAAAGFFAGRIAKGYMGAKLSARSNAATNAADAAASRRNEQIARIKSGDTRDEISSSFSEGTEKNIKRNQKRALGSIAAGAAFGAGGALIGDTLVNSFGIGSAEADTPQTQKHYERTRYGELFSLDGEPDDPSRLQLVHEDQNDHDDKFVRLQTADGTIIADNLELSEGGLTTDSIDKLEAAGYEANMDTSGDTGEGRLDISKSDNAESIANLRSEELKKMNSYLTILTTAGGETAPFTSLNSFEQGQVDSLLLAAMERSGEANTGINRILQSAGGSYDSLNAEQWAQIQKLLEDSQTA